MVALKAAQIDAFVAKPSPAQPVVLVFGPDRRALAPRRYRRALRAVLERAGCLVWVPPGVSAGMS